MHQENQVSCPRVWLDASVACCRKHPVAPTQHFTVVAMYQKQTTPPPPLLLSSRDSLDPSPTHTWHTKCRAGPKPPVSPVARSPDNGEHASAHASSIPSAELEPASIPPQLLSGHEQQHGATAQLPSLQPAATIATTITPRPGGTQSSPSPATTGTENADRDVIGTPSRSDGTPPNPSSCDSQLRNGALRMLLLLLPLPLFPPCFSCCCCRWDICGIPEHREVRIGTISTREWEWRRVAPFQRTRFLVCLGVGFNFHTTHFDNFVASTLKQLCSLVRTERNS